MIKAYSGTCDGLVYYYDPQLERILCRRYVRPRMSTANQNLCHTMQNLKTLELSPEYISDLRSYSRMLRKPGTRIPWFPIFIKLMYALARNLGTDLMTITKSAIYEQDLPCRSVKMAVEAGLLEPIPDYQRLDRDM